jgi:aquaporin Z
VLPYICSQFVGAFLASGAIRMLFPESRTLGATIPAGSDFQSLVLEFVLTLILMVVILSMACGGSEGKLLAGIAIGGVIGFEAMFAGPISGASMNPARSLAPAVVAMQLDHVWVYIVAPVAGALASVPLCRCIHSSPCCGSGDVGGGS